MRALVLLLSLILATSPSLAAPQKRSESIAAVVNAQAVTQSDVDDRMKMIMSSAGLPATPDVLMRVRPQVLSALVEEAIKNQEVARLGIKIEETDIDRAIADIAAQNKMSRAEFETMFRKRGLSLRSLRAQIRSNIGWMKVVTKKIRPDVDVTETDIDAELDILKSRVGQTEFRLGEIVLPIDRPQDEKNSRELAQKIIAQVTKKPDSFAPLAAQFSRVSSAAQGGHIGWIVGDQLQSDIAGALRGAKAGTLIGPYKTAIGLQILWVHDVRVRTAETLPTRDQIAEKIGTERLDRLQRRYYLDLRSAAFIENRL